MRNILKLKTDLHIHTKEDPLDGKKIAYNAFELIDIANKKGYDVISIANHDCLTNSYELEEYASKRDIVLMPGIEKTVEGKHVIFLNVNFDRLKDVKLLKEIEFVKEEKSLIIAPHPFFPHRTSLGPMLKEYIKFFDAIEYTSLYFRYTNFSTKGKKFAFRHELPIVGSSDAHFQEQIGRTYALIEADKNIDSIIKAIKSNKVELVSSPMPVNFKNIMLTFPFVMGALKYLFKKV